LRVNHSVGFSNFDVGRPIGNVRHNLVFAVAASGPPSVAHMVKPVDLAALTKLLAELQPTLV
jgi:hypothetical protein